MSERTVILFDNLHQQQAINDAAAIAQLAGWSPRTFYPNQLKDVERELTFKVEAFVTAMDDDDFHMAHLPLALPLLNTAAEQDIPTAILSNHPQAQQHINPDKGDAVLPLLEYDEARIYIRGWLGEVLMRRRY